MKRNLYRGFSSFEFQNNRTFTLTDVELVKLDLLNHIFTRRGERVNMPTFGTLIPDLAFEPLDDETLSTIKDELLTVFKYDPRVKLLSLVVTPYGDQSAVVAEARLHYLELNVTDTLYINLQFEAQL